MNKQKILFALITGELILISLIFLFFKFNSEKVLGDKIKINKIDKETVINNSKSKLSFFYEPKPNTTQTVYLPWGENGEKVIYKINSDGLNQLPDFPEKPLSENTFRIVLMGDSYVFGVNVNTESNLVSKLQEILDNQCDNHNYEVINLGVGGYDIQYPVERFRIRGIKYEPDLVLWYLGDENFRRLNELVIPYEQTIRKQLEESSENTDDLYLNSYIQAVKKVNSDLNEESIIKFQKVNMNKLNQYYSNPLVVFSFPIIKNSSKEIINEFTKSRPGIFFTMDITNIYELSDAYLPDKHPSEKGHTIIAHDLYNYLITKKLINCTK